MIHTPGVYEFTDLADVPNSFLGSALKFVTVNSTATGLEFTTGGGGGGIGDSFETVSKNLSAVDASFAYTGDVLTTITYTGGIIKTLNYTGDNLTSVVLSGSTPGGIDLTKTLSYTGDNLTAITYS
jgi:hypothetical protein